MVNWSLFHRVIHKDFATVLIRGNNRVGGAVALSGAELEREKKRGRGYGAGHQCDLQALSHNRVLIHLGKEKTGFTLAFLLPGT